MKVKSLTKKKLRKFCWKKLKMLLKETFSHWQSAFVTQAATQTLRTSITHFLIRTFKFTTLRGQSNNWWPWDLRSKKLKRRLNWLRKERKVLSSILISLLRKRISCTRSLSSFKSPVILAWCLEKWSSAKQAFHTLPISSSWVLPANTAELTLLKLKTTEKFQKRLFKSHSKSIRMTTSSEISLRAKHAKSQSLNWNLNLIMVLWAASIQQSKVCCKRFMNTWVEGTSFVMLMVSFLTEWRLSWAIWWPWKTGKNLSQSLSSTPCQVHFCKTHTILKKTKRQREFPGPETKTRMTFWDSKEWMSTTTNERQNKLLKGLERFKVFIQTSALNSFDISYFCHLSTVLIEN